MKSFPKLLLAGAAVLVVGLLYYFQSGDKKQLANVDDNTGSTTASKVTSTSDEQLAFTDSTGTTAAKTATKSKMSKEEILKSQDENPDYGTFERRYSEITARRNGQQLDVEQLWLASKQPNAWKPIDSIPDSLNLTDEEKNDGREFIEFSPMKLESLVAGDTLEIDMGKANKSFKAKINDAQSEDNGKNVTWTGTSVDENFPGRLTITKGDTLIVGGISTGDGHYEIQVQGNKGWIVSSSTLFKGVDEHVPVPQDLLDNPTNDVVHLPKDTVGGKKQLQKTLALIINTMQVTQTNKRNQK